MDKETIKCKIYQNVKNHQYSLVLNKKDMDNEILEELAKSKNKRVQIKFMK